MPVGPGRRATFASSNNSVAAKSLYYPGRPKSTLYLYEDRRLWHPLGKNAFPKSKKQAYPRVVDYTPLPISPIETDPFPSKRPRLPYRGVLPIPKGHDYFPGTNPGNYLDMRASPVSWENPYDMIICLKRKIRREMMHALGIAGSHKIRYPKYTQFSFVRCR